MINLARLLVGDPITIAKGVQLFQPSLLDIVKIGDEKYSRMLNIWLMEKKEVVENNLEDFSDISEYEFWKVYVLASSDLREILKDSVLIFFRKKIDFFPAGGTIYIGDIADGTVLDEKLFNLIKGIFKQLVTIQQGEKTQQYKEDAPTSAHAASLLARMKKHDEKIEKMKEQEMDSREQLGRSIIALVAIGRYTYEQVYNMTMLQFNNLLKKHIDIESYTLYTIISPHISSSGGEETNKHWLKT
jgi:hypothetical protein